MDQEKAVKLTQKPECKICYGEFTDVHEPQMLECGHTFCSDCMKTINKRCVYCKQESTFVSNQILQKNLIELKDTVCFHCLYPFWMSGNQIMRVFKESEELCCKECAENYVQIDLPKPIKNLELVSLHEDN